MFEQSVRRPPSRGCLFYVLAFTVLIAGVARADATGKNFDDAGDDDGTDFVYDESRFPQLSHPVQFDLPAAGPSAPSAAARVPTPDPSAEANSTPNEATVPDCARPSPTNSVQTIREITQQIQTPPLPPPRPASPPLPPPRPPEISTCALTKVLASAKQHVRTRWGNRPYSGGQCGLGVRGSLQASRVGGVIGGLGNAIDYLKNLKPHGFVDSGLRDPDKAPPGAIIVFAGPNTASYLRSGQTGRPLGNWVGHITIKGDDGFYYTDARTREPAVGWSGGRNVRRVRNVAGIFVPGPALAARYANRCTPTRLAANH